MSDTIKAAIKNFSIWVAEVMLVLLAILTIAWIMYTYLGWDEVPSHESSINEQYI